MDELWRAALNEDQLRAMLRGEIVSLPGIEIALSDIGHDRVLCAALDALPAKTLAAIGPPLMASRAAHYDPSKPLQNCSFCGQEFHGPSVYCSHICAIKNGN